MKYAVAAKALRTPSRSEKMPVLCAVMGYPISHSRSPEIHAHFASQFGLDLQYRRIEVAPGSLPAAVASFRAMGGVGCNVTVPLKEEAAGLSDELGFEAARSGAVNTLTTIPGGRTRGDNTDGVGLIRQLRENLGVHLEGSKMLMIGAGGAVRGVLPALLAARAAEIVIANRTVERARDLARRFARLGEIRVAASDRSGLKAVDIVINASSAGMAGLAPSLPATVAKGALCVDLAYGPAAEPFMAWARSGGARAVHDGWGMLVEQAAESFSIWHGHRPDTTALIEG